MDILTRATKFAFNYFKTHEMTEDDNYDISCVEILNFSQDNEEWSVTFNLPYGLIYMMKSLNEYDIYFTQYKYFDCYIYKWRADDD